MFLFSTIIYSGDDPTGYEVFKEADGFFFKKAIGAKNRILPEEICVEKIGADWRLKETLPTDIEAQVISIVSVQGVMNKIEHLKVSA